MHSFLKVASLRETRCKQSWDQFEKYGSRSLRYVMRVSGKRKDHRWRKKVKVPHQGSPNVMKFEDRSHEESERQQRCARSKAWNLAQNIFKLKEEDKATFHSPAEEWVLPAASTRELEEREFVVDSEASVHMVSKKDLNSAELETMRTSRSPTTVMTANGEVQTREEATVDVKQLGIFVKVMLLEETHAVLSFGKLCEDHGDTYHLISGQNPHLIKNGKRIDCTMSNYVPFVVPGLSASYSSTTPSPSSPSSSSQESVFDVDRHKNPAIERSVEVRVESFRETRCSKPQKPKTKIRVENQKKYKEIYRLNCLIGYRNSGRIWLMKVLQQSLGETQSRGSQDTCKSSHELPMEPRAKVEPVSGKHSVHTHFPKDPHCDICLKTKIKRVSCRRRAATVVPRAEHFGDLITADHKVLI